jgi:hypothetical protein
MLSIHDQEMDTITYLAALAKILHTFLDPTWVYMSDPKPT